MDRHPVSAAPRTSDSARYLSDAFVNKGTAYTLTNAFAWGWRACYRVVLDHLEELLPIISFVFPGVGLGLLLYV